jgi:DNA repair exonuclease SbcCD ATPase subunit
MGNTLKSSSKAHRDAIAAREALQTKLAALESSIEEASEARGQLRAVEKARKAELGAARLDGRTADVASLDKRAKALRASVESLEADEAARDVLAERIAAAKDAEAAAKAAFDKAAVAELSAREKAAEADFDAALTSLRDALCHLQAIQYARPKFGANYSALWSSRSMKVGIPYADGKPFHAPHDHEVDPLAAAIVAEVAGA